jgi:ClpX C4-type zinc finger
MIENVGQRSWAQMSQGLSFRSAREDRRRKQRAGNQVNGDRRHQRPTPPGAAGELPSCSFCGKQIGTVETLIAGESAHICNECVDRVHAVLGAAGNTARTPGATWRSCSP